MNIKELAKYFANQFVTKTRSNGDNYLCIDKNLHDDENKDLRELIYDAHSDFAPDDYKYQFIHEALEAIAETDDIDDIDLEADCYTADLLKWVSSNLKRTSYCDEVLAQSYDGQKLQFANLLMYAQYEEKREVLACVRHCLEQLTENQ